TRTARSCPYPIQAPASHPKTKAACSAASSACRPNRPAARARPVWVSRSSSESSICMAAPSWSIKDRWGAPVSHCRFPTDGPMSQNQTHKIVVVDDEAAARDMIGDYLKMHGFAVTLCDGGPALRAHVKKDSPDLVVLDLNMPEEDGLSLIRFLKQE